MKTIVGACLSQFHGDPDNYEFLIAYSDGREIGNVLPKQVAQSIAKDMAEQTNCNDPVQAFAEWLNAGAEIAMAAGNAIDVRVTTKDGNKLRLTSGSVVAKAEARS